MSLTDALARPLTSALALSVLGFGGAQTLEQQVDEILETEAVSGDAVAQYNQQDLTSMFVETNGSGGNPTVGDSVGFIADTARFEGKTFDQFVQGQTELVTNGGFDTDSDFTKGSGWSISGGVAVASSANGTQLAQSYSFVDGATYLLRFDLVTVTAGNVLPRLSGATPVNASAATTPGSYSFLLTANSTNSGFNFLGQASFSGTIDNVSLVEIPGYHLIAASDAARPVLLDSFDQSGAALTDNGGRGENLIDGVTPTLGTGWTDNGDESYDVAATGYAGGTWAFDLEIGAEYEVTFEIYDYVSGGVSANLGSSGSGNSSYRFSGSTQVGASGVYTSDAPIRYWGGEPAQLHIRANDGGAFTGKIRSISVKRISTTFDGQANLVTNGTFDTDTDWTKGTGWSIGSGVATGATAATLYQDSVATASKWHRFVFYVSSYTSGTITPNLGGASGASVSSAGWHVQYIRANGSRANLLGSSFVGSIDNVIVQEVPSSIERIYFLSTDGSDDQIETDFTGSSSDTIVMAVRTSDAEGILLRGDATTRYLLAIDDGNASATLHGDAGTPTLRLDGAAWSPASQDAVHTDLSDDNWHVVTVQAADFSSWSKVILGFFDTSSSFNTAMDIAYGPVILPDPSAEDLATIEQAAAAACGVTLA